MSTVPQVRPPKQRKPRPQPARSIRWLTNPLTAGRPYGAVEIVRGGNVAFYYLHELPAADGRGFELEKINLLVPLEERERYHVFLSGNGQGSTCECLGFLHCGRCKHLDGIAALAAKGVL